MSKRQQQKQINDENNVPIPLTKPNNINNNKVTTLQHTMKNASINEADLFQQAKALFRRTTIPTRLIGRDHELSILENFWEQHVIQNRPGCLYISGSPGTGKTAMLDHVINSYQNKKNTNSKINKNNKNTHQTKTIMINCMSVNEPKAIYAKLITELKPSFQPTLLSSNEILLQTEQLLNGKKNILNVIILDEIDHLVTKDQDVLYKIFEWASLPQSRLVLIGIANALDLTDRVLPRLRAKNCEPQLLHFNPYQVNDISAIIKDRLTSLNGQLVQPPAIELCARKVAASKGDLRTALDVCRQAIEIAEKEYKRKPNINPLGNHNCQPQQQQQQQPKVTIAHIVKVLQSVFGNPMMEKLNQFNLQQKIVLGTLSKVKEMDGQVTMVKFRQIYTSILRNNGTLNPLTSTELTDIISTIETNGILTFKSKSKDIMKRQLVLNVQETDIQKMIDQVPILQTLFK
ncbi:P-loop containing nucleoside triphosphate hydrolase protein [Cunninghamella echinulata]|nr:P-loop containing nucleoside triphosphate hydrolase protein [Cunninghamella echinulata]